MITTGHGGREWPSGKKKKKKSVFLFSGFFFFYRPITVCASPATVRRVKRSNAVYVDIFFLPLFFFFFTYIIVAHDNIIPRARIIRHFNRQFKSLFFLSLDFFFLSNTIFGQIARPTIDNINSAGPIEYERHELNHQVSIDTLTPWNQLIISIYRPELESSARYVID